MSRLTQEGEIPSPFRFPAVGMDFSGPGLTFSIGGVVRSPAAAGQRPRLQGAPSLQSRVIGQVQHPACLDAAAEKRDLSGPSSSCSGSVESLPPLTRGESRAAVESGGALG